MSLARAAYSESDVILLDDPLSAVDAYVGKAILENCLLAGPLADRTRILVTHALHVLDKTDYIYVMDSGIIIEQGTYEVRVAPKPGNVNTYGHACQTLMQGSMVFSRLMDEYGSLEHEEDGGKKFHSGTESGSANNSDEIDDKKATAALMQVEERNTGSVAWSTYAKYLRFAGGIIWAPIIVLLLTLTQSASGISERAWAHLMTHFFA